MEMFYHLTSIVKDEVDVSIWTGLFLYRSCLAAFAYNAKKSLNNLAYMHKLSSVSSFILKSKHFYLRQWNFGFVF